jgi:adenosylcobinamide kinase/adenosylcobinamide-phosphate guanylyltransferase
MAKEVVLITGGARSGKSRYAEERAAGLGARLLYLATGEPGDEEMARRIAEHRKRRGERWVTIEEPLQVRRTLAEHQGKVDCAVVDCLTLWVSNLLIQRGEESVTKATEDLIQGLPQLNFHLLFVTNEVGWGIVPDNSLARQFRDLSGWANQRIAEVVDEVVLMIAGIPFTVKKASL